MKSIRIYLVGIFCVCTLLFMHCDSSINPIPIEKNTVESSTQKKEVQKRKA